MFWQFIRRAGLAMLAGGILSFTAVNLQAQEKQKPPKNPPPQMQKMQPPEVEVSDVELKTFAEVFGKAQNIQKQARLKMVKVVKDEGLKVQRYNEIMKNKKSGAKRNVDVSKAEKKKVQKATQRIQKIQSGMQDEIVKTIQKGGMKPRRFQTILTAVRSDPALQKRLQQIRQN